MPADTDNTNSPELAVLMEEIARLRAELEAARRYGSEQEQRANLLDNQYTQASSRAATAEMAQMAAPGTDATNRIAALDAEIRGLKERIAVLNSEGKYAEAAELTEQMADAAANRLWAREAQTHFAAQKQQHFAAPTDPVEQYIAANSHFTREDADWIRRNRSYALDENFRNRVNQAHNEAVDTLGLIQFSPEYYQHLEQRGYARPDQQAIDPGRQTNGRTTTASGGDGEAATGYAGWRTDKRRR